MTNPLLDFTLTDLLRAQEIFDLAQRALDETGASGTAIALRQGDTFVCCAVAGETAPTLGVSLQTDEGITAACLTSGQTEICHDVALDSRVNAEACEQLQIASVIVVPVLDSGEVIGIVEALSREPYAFSAAQQSSLEALARQLQPSNSGVPDESTLEPPVNIDRFSPRAAGLNAVTDLEVAEVAPEAAPLSATDDSPVLLSTVYSGEQAQGSWARGIVIAVVFVCVVVASAIFLTRLAQNEALQERSRSQSTAAELPIAAPPAPAISPKSDSAEGIAELQAAAAAGNAASQLKLATALARGNGVQKDLVSAYAWYIAANMSGADDPSKFLPSLSKRLSASQTAEVRVKLAEMFWKGTGVKQDSTAAYTWLLLAQAAGSSKAHAYQQRLAAEMNDYQIREAEHKAETWLRQHHQTSLRR